MVARLLRVPTAHGGAETAIGIAPFGAGDFAGEDVYYCEPRLPAAFSGAAFLQLSATGVWLLLHSPEGVAVVELPSRPAAGGAGGSVLGALAGLAPAGGPVEGAGVSPRWSRHARFLRAAFAAPELFARGAFPASDVRWHPWSARHFVALSRDGLRTFDAAALLDAARGEGGRARARPAGLVGELLFPPRALRCAPVCLAWGAGARPDPRRADWAAVAAVVTCLDGAVYVACPLLPPGARLPRAAAERLLADAAGWEAAAGVAGGEGVKRARVAAKLVRCCLRVEGDAGVWGHPESTPKGGSGEDRELVPALQGPVAVLPLPRRPLFDPTLGRGAFACDAVVVPCTAALLALAVLGADGRLALLVAPTPVAPAWCVSRGGGAAAGLEELPGSGATGPLVPLGGGDPAWGEEGWGGAGRGGGGGGGGEAGCAAFSPHPPWLIAATADLSLGSPVVWAAARISGAEGTKVASFSGGQPGEGAYAPEVLHVPRLASGHAMPADGVLVVGARTAHFVSLAKAAATAERELHAAASSADVGGGGSGAHGGVGRDDASPHPEDLLNDATCDVVGSAPWADYVPATGDPPPKPLLLWTVDEGAAAGAAQAHKGGAQGERLSLRASRTAAVTSTVFEKPGGLEGKVGKRVDDAAGGHPTFQVQLSDGGGSGTEEGVPLQRLLSPAGKPLAAAPNIGDRVRCRFKGCEKRSAFGSAFCALDALPVPSKLEHLDDVISDLKALDAWLFSPKRPADETCIVCSEGGGEHVCPHCGRAAFERATSAVRAWRDLSFAAAAHATICKDLKEYGKKRELELTKEMGENRRMISRLCGGGGGGGGGGDGAVKLSQEREPSTAEKKLAAAKKRLYVAHFLQALLRAKDVDRLRAEARAAAGGGGAHPGGAAMPAAASFKEERAFEKLCALRDEVKRCKDGHLKKALDAQQQWVAGREEAPAGAGADDPEVRRLEELLKDLKLKREQALAVLSERGKLFRGRSQSPYW
jgi:hypothetical protein